MTILEKALRWTVISGIFALPFICFIVTTSLFFPYITGKNFTFRVIVEVITGAWLALALIYPAYRPKRSWVLIALAAFVFIIAIADAQGVYPFKSFWSNYERMDGWVTLIHVLLLTVVASIMLDSEKLWRRLWETSLAVSVVVSLYGFMQIAGTLALGEGGVSGWMARIDATFGNPIYLAVYMLFHIFVAAWLWARARAEKSASARKPLVIWYGFVIVVDTLALLFSGTRGTMLGLIGGAVLALVAYSVTPSASSKVKHWAIGLMTATCIFGGGLWLARDTTLVHTVGFLDRLASISLSDNTTKARLMNMGMAWEGFKERPLLGWGQENYAIVFDKYYNPQMYAQEPWFDRVHNIIFDWLIAGGLLGLLAYLSIFAATLLALWRPSDERGSTQARRTDVRPSDERVGANKFSDAEKAIFTGLLGGYFFHNLFVFDNITSYILFALVLAYLVWRSAGERHTFGFCDRQFLPTSALAFTSIVGVAFAFGALWYVNVNALAANRTLLLALSQQPDGPTANLALYQRSIGYGTYGMQEAREQLAQVATQVAGASNVGVSVKQAFFDVAMSEMQKQEAMSPLDARFPLFLGIVQGSFGDLADAAVSLEKAHELSPDKQSILYQIASLQDSRGDSIAALQTLRQAYQLAPDNNEARLLYAAALIVNGKETDADALIEPLVESGQAANSHIATAYASRGEYGKIVPIWVAYVKANPTDAQGYFTLAAAYVGMHDPANAIATLKAVEQALPSTASQAEQFITQIQNGTAKVQ